MEPPELSAVAECPKCSYPAPERAIECPACGVVFAKDRPPGVAPTFAAPTTEEDGDLVDPYAPPESELWAPRTCSTW